jgi:asparagine synthase (glutamine-hydrolysing)
MCGIAGEIRFDAAPDAAAVARMADALVHRGPDAGGFFTEGPAALGHRRLSILDIEGGTQPMTRDGVTLVFNGQAYDHERLRAELRGRGHGFTTRSDTEVVLRAYLEWGEAFAERVDGMFAIALWDARQRKLVLARDRIGKKPLYYALGQGSGWVGSVAEASAPPLAASRLLFGSELKALVAHGAVPREIDPESVAQYLAVEYVPAPRSIFAGVRKLPAAHVAVLDERGFRMRRYWHMPRPEAPTDAHARVDLDEAAAELLRALDGAVARRLVADVPVGVFLSGGVDSTAIAALAVRHHRPLQTFCIGFSEATFDESEHASFAARELGTEHHTEVLSGSACVDLLPAVARHLDEPFGDPSILPTHLLSRFARRHVKVALAGDGGDELFAGYDPFLAHRPGQWLSRLPAPARAALARAVSLLPASATNMSLDFRLKQLVRGLSVAPALRHASWIGSFSPAEIAPLLSAGLRPFADEEVVYREILAEAERARSDGIAPESVDGALHFYLTRYLVDDILVKADRASMMASLEVRAPFLDTQVVELAARLPWQTKLGLTDTKRILRRSLAGVIPRAILVRPKKGFGIPVARWIRGPLRPLFEDLFSPGALAASGLFEPAVARAWLDRHLRGEADHRKPLWTLAMLLLWQRQWAR